MPGLRTIVTNRLLALEYELLQVRQAVSGQRKKEKQRSELKVKKHQVTRNIERPNLSSQSQLPKNYSLFSTSHSSPNSSSLFQLERKILGLRQKHCLPVQEAFSQPQHLTQQIKSARVESMAFDTGEAIQLHYHYPFFQATQAERIRIENFHQLNDRSAVSLSQSQQVAPAYSRDAITHSNPASPLSSPPSPLPPSNPPPLRSHRSIPPPPPPSSPPPRRRVPAPPPVPAPSLKQTTPPPIAQRQPASHAIFDQIAQNMTYATAFDLGTVSIGLEQRFDEFDRRLDNP